MAGGGNGVHEDAEAKPVRAGGDRRQCNGYLLGVPALVVGLFVFGFATGTRNVAMNVQGAFVGMSAAADDPRFAAQRVSIVASVGYWAFLAGPPLLGFLGDHITVLRALVAVGVLLALAALLTGNLRRREKPISGASLSGAELAAREETRD